MQNTEERFYEAFGIEPKIIKCKVGGDGDFCPFGFGHQCCECDVAEIELSYPPITPEIVLKLLFILNKRKCGICIQGYETEKEFKDYILWSCIRADGIYEEVKAVFNDK